MLNGLDPVLVFHFKKLVEDNYTDDFIGPLPLAASTPKLVPQLPIPIYLSEAITGLFIDNEDKNVDIETNTQTLASGQAPKVDQKGINSSISINLFAKKDSIAFVLLSALIDSCFDKLSSKEYHLSYLHGPTTIFKGKLQSYQVNQNPMNDLLAIQLIISKGEKAPKEVKTREQVPLANDTKTFGGQK